MAHQCSYNELCGYAAAERVEHQQQQAHRNPAKRLEQPETGWDTCIHLHCLVTTSPLGISVSAHSLGSHSGRVPSLPYSISGDWLSFCLSGTITSSAYVRTWVPCDDAVILSITHRLPTHRPRTLLQTKHGCSTSHHCLCLCGSNLLICSVYNYTLADHITLVRDVCVCAAAELHSITVQQTFRRLARCVGQSDAGKHTFCNLANTQQHQVPVISSLCGFWYKTKAWSIRIQLL